MTDLKDYCLTRGNGPLHPDGFHSCYENPVIAHLKARIAKLEEPVEDIYECPADPTGSPTFTGTFTPPLYDQLVQAQARIAELDKDNAFLRAQFEAAKWIPCSERMPEEGIPVLFHEPGVETYPYQMFVGFKKGRHWIPNADSTEQGDIEWERDEWVSHWMPLPAPPQPAVQHLKDEGGK